MSRLLKFFQVFDLFGTNFNFTNYKSKKFHTPLGVFLSFVVYILVSAFIGVFGIDMFNRTNPKIVFQQVLPEDYPQIFPDPKNFTYAWTIEDDLGYWNMTNKLYSRMVYRKLLKDEEGTLQIVSERYLNQTLCSDVYVADEKFRNKYNLEHWTCLNFQDQNVSIGGNWGEKFLDLLSIELYYCPDNNSTHPNCTTVEELKEFTLTKKLYFCGAYPEFYFDVSNLENPLRYQYVYQYNQISMNLINSEYVYYKQIEALDDQNLIRTEFVEHSQLVKNKIINYFAFKDTKDYDNKNLGTDLYTSLLYLLKDKDKYTRTFMKLQDLAALVGGFMTIVSTIGKIICTHYNTYQRYIFLINELFVYENTKDSISGVSKIEKESFTDNKLFPTTTNNHAVSATKDSKDNEDIQIIYIQKKNGENLKNDGQVGKNHKSPFPNLLDNSFSKEGGGLRKVSEKVHEPNSQLEKRKTTLSIGNFVETREKELRQKLKDNHQSNLAKKKENWFSLGFFLFLKKYLCRKKLERNESQKVEVYDFAIEYIVDKLDIANYIYMIQTLDRMKLFNYNDSQVIGLDYCKNPNLKDMDELRQLDIKPEKYSLDDEKKNDDELRIHDQNEQLQLIKYFVTKLNSDSLDSKDQKIFEILDRSIKNLIIEESRR